MELDGEGLEDERASDPEQIAAKAQLKARVRSAVAELPADQREIVQSCDVEGQSLGQAAAAAGVSKSWASRLRARALRSLSEVMRRKPFRQHELRSGEQAGEAQHELKPAASMAEQSGSFANQADGAARVQRRALRSRVASLRPISGQAPSDTPKATSRAARLQAEGAVVATMAAAAANHAAGAKGPDDGQADGARARDAMAGRAGPSDADGRGRPAPVREPQRQLWAAAKRAPAIRFLLEVWRRWRQNPGAAEDDDPSIRGVEWPGAEHLVAERDDDLRGGPHRSRGVRRPRDGPLLHHGRWPRGRRRPRETILDRRARLRANRAQTSGLSQSSA